MSKVWQQCCAKVATDESSGKEDDGKRCHQVYSSEGRLCPGHLDHEAVYPQRIVPLITYKGVFNFTDYSKNSGDFSTNYQSPVEITDHQSILALAFKSLLQADIMVKEVGIISWSRIN